MDEIFEKGYWRNVETIGRGGQGTAYKVTRTAEGYPQFYVLKVLHSEDEQALVRFRKDAQAVSALSNPHVIKMHEDHTDKKPAYYVTEFCSGGNLEKAKSEFTDNISRGLQIFEEICMGIESAHKKDITHRDIKPENILLSVPNGKAIVADFGICHLQDEVRVTKPTERVGPRDYMAPELERAGVLDVSPVNDVYSLGKVLHFLLSGGHPVYREEHREPEFDLVRLHGNGRLEHINNLLDKMIVRDPRRRLMNASLVLHGFREVRRLVDGGYNVVGSKVPQPCMYCGSGVYKMTVDASKNVNDSQSTDMHNFTGNYPIAGSDWRILVCDECGHVQWFRADKSNNRW